MTKFVTIVGVPPVSNFDQTTNSRFVILSTQPMPNFRTWPDVSFIWRRTNADARFAGIGRAVVVV